MKLNPDNESTIKNEVIIANTKISFFFLFIKTLIGNARLRI